MDRNIGLRKYYKIAEIINGITISREEFDKIAYDTINEAESYIKTILMQMPVTTTLTTVTVYRTAYDTKNTDNF